MELANVTRSFQSQSKTMYLTAPLVITSWRYKDLKASKLLRKFASIAVCIHLRLKSLVKIAGSRSKTASLDFKVDGPMQRPAAALIRMFGALRQARVDHCNPTSPHWEYDPKTRKRSSMMCWSSGHGEGSDEFVPVQSRSPKRTKEAVLANEGFINGNGRRAV